MPLPIFTARNETRGVLVAPATERAETAFARLKGLLGREAMKNGAGLHIVPCTSIHTFFMRFPIDVAFLDEEGRVIHLIHAMPPWRVSRIYFSSHSALELPAGTLARCGTQVGDRLAFVQPSHGGVPA